MPRLRGDETRLFRTQVVSATDDKISRVALSGDEVPLFSDDRISRVALTEVLVSH